MKLKILLESHLKPSDQHMLIKKLFKKGKSSKPMKRDFVTLLEEVENRGKACLDVSITLEVAGKLDQFLKEKGFYRKEGIPMLIEYGLSGESKNELEKLNSEKASLAGQLLKEYAVMRFRIYEYLMENKSMTIRLRSLLTENRSLKERLKKEGFQSCISQDDWDNWDEETIDNLFHKYVFTNRR